MDIEKKGKSNFTVEKRDKHHLNQMIKINIYSNNSRWKHVPLMCYENGNLSLWSSPQNLLPQSNHEKYQPSPRWEIAYKIPS